MQAGGTQVTGGMIRDAERPSARKRRHLDRPLVEKLAECGFHIANGLLKGLGIGVGKPRLIRFDSCDMVDKPIHLHDFLPSFPDIDTKGENTVVDVADGSEVIMDGMALGSVGIESDFIGDHAVPFKYSYGIISKVC